MVLHAASDWALRRLLKVVLKRNLKHVFATELDVEQLRVSLGTGALELTDVLLSPEWLAQQAVRRQGKEQRGAGWVAHEGAPQQQPASRPPAWRAARPLPCPP